MTERDPFELADEQELEADDMQRHSDEVERAVRETRDDWQRKRADDAVPGANPPPESKHHGESENDSKSEKDAETPREGGAGPPADNVSP